MTDREYQWLKDTIMDYIEMCDVDGAVFDRLVEDIRKDIEG